MSRITAGGFSEEDQSRHAVAALLQAGFDAGSVASFSVTGTIANVIEPVNAHGEAGAEDAGTGAAGGVAGGGVVGVVVGLATAPVLGPMGAVVGAAVGAYVGSLVGTLNQLEDPVPGSEAQQAEDVPIHAASGPPRSARWLTAVVTSTPQQQETAIAVLKHMQARDLEAAEGQIVAGRWIDFDPAIPMKLVA